MPLIVSGTDSITLPVGTTAQRNTTPVTGMYRLNSTNGTTEYYNGTNWVSGNIVSGTVLAYNWNGLTTNTYLDFTGIPAGVKRITVMFSSVSTSGTSPLQIQLGAGSVTITGYLSASSFIASTVTTANSTTGLIVGNNRAAADLQHGSAIISGLGSNTWVMQSLLGTTSGASPITTTGGGSITLSGTLDRVRITTVNGTDTFDAGQVNILYE